MEIRKESLEAVDGVPAQIGFYLAGMEEVRGQLRKAVEGVSNEIAHARLRPDAHSITQLILHCGEAEWWWIQCVVKGEEIDDELKSTAFWDVLEEGNEPSSAMSATSCVKEIDRISEMTRDHFSSFSDGDLDKVYARQRSDGGGGLEASLRWILHHLIDHEAQHKGQILMLKRMLSADSKS